MERRILRYPATTSTAACLALLALGYWTAGALWPTDLPSGASSSAQITGMALMLILLPPYFVAAAFVTQRRSLDLVGQLRPQLPDPRFADEAAAAIRSGLEKSWLPGAVLGVVMGLFNSQLIYALTQSPTPAIAISIASGQIFLWLLVGLVIGMRTISARAFSRLGEAVEFDLFDLDRLKPLARRGSMDVLVIAGALAISPLQSLDAEFRWYNYNFALAIAIPAALLLLLWPLWPVHRRIRAEKSRRLAQVDALIQETRATESPDQLLRLESLLAHRDRLHQQRTWPLSTALISRVFLYLIIPPLAWAGAAVVEMFVGRALAS